MFNENQSLLVSQETRKSKFYTVFLTCFAAIGGLLFGYDTGIISGSMLLMKDHFKLSTIYQEAIVSATIGAAALFALLAGFVSDYLGRKIVIMIASLVFTSGAVLMAVAEVKEELLVGRLIVGAGIGFASMSVPMYIAETSPADIRGALVSLNQLFITLGILLSSIVAGAFSNDIENGWRYMLGLAGIPSIIQLVGFFFLPESPRWLVNKGKIEQARTVLTKLRRLSKVDLDLTDMEDSVRSSKRYYSASILRMSEFPSRLAIWLVCIPNAANFLCTFIGIYLIDRTGRRVLILGSFIGVIIALLVLGAGFQLAVVNTPPVVYNETNGKDTTCETKYLTCDSCVTDHDCGFCFVKDSPTTSGSCIPASKEHPERYADPDFWNKTEYPNSTFRCDERNYDDGMKVYIWDDNFCPTEYSWMAVLGLALFVIGFSPGLGPIPWAVNSEIYPMWARGTGMSVATAVNWLANLLVSMTFLSLLETITTYGTFYLFFGISLVGLICMWIMLPETKNKKLEDIQELFTSVKIIK